VSRPTYDDNQINKPLKVCLRCKRAWYMLADVCIECRDPYAQSGHGRTQSRLDVNGVEMTDP
jgi:hypothetical protein